MPFVFLLALFWACRLSEKKCVGLKVQGLRMWCSGGGLKVTASGMNGDTVQGFEVPVSRGTGRVKGWGSEFRA